MAEALPISCVLCRLKKIKCNKKKPCNQCLRRSIPCHFPSTFRNKRINEEELDESISWSRTRVDESSYPKIKREDDDERQIQIHQPHQLDLVRNENARLLLDIVKLNIKLSELTAELNNKSLQTAPGKGIEIVGETTENGEKYYGPQSSTYMIETLKEELGDAPEAKDLDSNDTDLKVGDKRGLDIDSPSTIHDPADLTDSNLHPKPPKHVNSDLTVTSTPHEDPSLLERSLWKKLLPILILDLLRYDHDMGTDSPRYHELVKSNKATIYQLVENFFRNSRHRETFISREKVFAFLESYDEIKDKEWENDDDLLLFYMILLLLIQKLSPSEVIALNLLPPASIKHYDRYKAFLCKSVLNDFDKLRHNLLNESILTIQAYILCTEHYYVEKRYEECWSMMFHCCLIAYSIGLHVMGQFRTINSTSSNNGLTPVQELDDEDDEKVEPSKPVEEEEEADDEDMDFTRYKVFFALKNLTGQVCSILGRPNPISIQVNSVVSKSTAPDAVNMDLKKVAVILKSGLSECLRLLNSMLIENFMIDFTITDLLTLNAKFDIEINLLDKFYNDTFKLGNTTPDSSTGLNLNEISILNDLIVLHINKAKLCEPFVTKFAKDDLYDAVIQNLVSSIIRFLELLNHFVDKFLSSIVDRYFQESNEVESSPEEKMSPGKSPASSVEIVGNHARQNVNLGLRFGKLFRTFFPFLNSFIYQGVIVIFTFLHYKTKEFVSNSSVHLNNEVLKTLELHLNSLLNVDRRLAGILNHVTKLWSSNIVYLINKVLNHIKLIYQKQERKNETANQRKKRKHDIRQAYQQLQILYQNKTAQAQQKDLNDFQTQSQPEQFNTDDKKEFNLPVPLDNLYDPHATSLELDNLYGFRLNDPFWITNPENLPYYLSSPSDDGVPLIKDLNDLINSSVDTSNVESQGPSSHATSSMAAPSRPVSTGPNLRDSKANDIYINPNFAYSSGQDNFIQPQNAQHTPSADVNFGTPYMAYTPHESHSGYQGMYGDLKHQQSPEQYYETQQKAHTQLYENQHKAQQKLHPDQFFGDINQQQVHHLQQQQSQQLHQLFQQHRQQQQQQMEQQFLQEQSTLLELQQLHLQNLQLEQQLEQQQQQLEQQLRHQIHRQK